MAEDHNDSENKMALKRKGLKKTRKDFWLFTVGFILTLVPFSSMLVLQSSINIEESKGTLALGLSYVVALIATIFVAPVAIRRIGSKWSIVIGELGFLIYIAANFYPKKYIMFTAGVLSGFGEALLWTCLPLYCWSFGYLHGQFGSKPFEFYVQKYIAMFWAVVLTSRISGNAISYAVLFGFKNKTERMAISDSHENSTQYLQDKYQYCGPNDCQDSNITRKHIDKYVPEDSTSLYILISIFCAMNITGICLQIRFLSDAVSKHAMTDDKTNTSNVKDKNVTKDGAIEVKIGNYKSTLLATFRHLISVKQVLITPLITYRGLMSTFVISECIRAYVSCILGVEQIGAVMILYLATGGTTSALTGKLIKKFGRNRIILFNSVLSTSILIFELFWRINEQTKYLVYLLYFLFGITIALWRNCNMDIYTWYFPQNQEISYAVWNFWATIGFAIGFLWSGIFCVETKIYILIGSLLVSMICYGFAEHIHERQKSLSVA